MPADRPSTLPAWLAPLAGLASRVYAAELARRNRAFDAGVGVTALDRTVISVGNLSVGGTGKTPLVARICRDLLDAGRRPVIAMRGYKPGPTGLSDEAEAYRRALPGVPVVAQPDRLAGLAALFATDAGRDADAVVLDDGFQHRRIARDLDLVLIDAGRDPFADRPLPAGRLREPVGSLARAHALVLTHAESVHADELARTADAVERVAGAPPVAITRHDWAGLDLLDGDGDRSVPISWLAGRRVVAACAIGRPEPFLDRVGAEAGRLVDRLVLRDHDPYRPSRVQQLIDLASRANADAIVTTSKDWAKLAGVNPGLWPCPVARPRLELRFDAGEAAFHHLVMKTVEGASARSQPAAAGAQPAEVARDARPVGL